MTRPYLTYPDAWNKATLEPNKEMGVINSVISGGTPSTKINKYWEGDIPWLTPREICNGKNPVFITKTERCITKEGLDNSGARINSPSTVMLTKRAPVGEVAINTIPMATNQGFLNFSCGDNLDSVFLYFWLKANKPYLHKIANGSTYKELYISDLSEIIIGFPSLSEQKKIVKFLLSLRLSISLGRAIESTENDISEIKKVQKDTQYLNKIQDNILLSLMSGKTSVKSDIHGR